MSGFRIPTVFEYQTSLLFRSLLHRTRVLSPLIGSPRYLISILTKAIIDFAVIPRFARLRQVWFKVQNSFPSFLNFRLCPFCQTSVSVRGGWYTRHIKTCKSKDSQPETLISEPDQESPTPQRHLSTESMTIDDEMSKIALLPEMDEQDRVICRNCGQYFRKIGGWHTKHVLYCIGENKKNSQVKMLTIQFLD